MAGGHARGRVWVFATILFALLSVIGFGWGYLQSERADQLEAQNRLQAATLQEASKRDLPVTVSFRPAMLSNGMVAVIRNNSGSTLEIAAHFSSPATGQGRQANLVVPGGGTVEFGEREGWAFASGHRIALTNNQFRGAEYTVP